jgi:tetratricopeptide (TPR) repeat protein
MIDDGPEKQNPIVEGFVERLLDEGFDRSILEEYCEQYPDLRETLEGTYAVVTAVDEAFREDGLAGAVVGDFLICEEIGRGGMGVVYLALQQSLDRYVALKVLPSGLAAGSGFLKGMQAEARMIARFNHPNIVPIFSTGSDKGIYYIAMALIPGLPLSRVLEALRPLPPDQIKASSVREMMLAEPDLTRINLDSTEAGQPGSIMVTRDPSFWDQPYPRFVLSLCSEIADALGYAHRNGVCHGDLKPSNIMLTAGGIPMIVDFGLARDLRTLASVQSQDFLGTLAYASPEHLSGNVRSEASDIWSLGVTMYEMITLRQPFRTGDVAGTLARIARMEPPSMGSGRARVSRDVEAVVSKCLEKEPRMRYSDADRLKEDIDNVLASRPVTARPIGRPGRVLRWAKRNRAVSLLCLFLLVSAAVAAYALFNFAIRNAVAEGTRYADEGKYTEALRSYERAFGLLRWVPFSTERRADVMSDLGNGWSGKGDYEKAIRFFEAALRLDPDSTSALMGLGDVYFEKGAYDRTIAFYDRVLLLSPEDRNSYYQRGKAYKEKGRYNDALRDFRAAIRIAPDDLDTIKEISRVLRKKGLPTERSRRACLQAEGFNDQEIGAILRAGDRSQ